MILGFNLNHDYAMCIIENNQIRLIEQERISRIRYHWTKESYTLELLDKFSNSDLRKIKYICINSPRLERIKINNGNLSSSKRAYYYSGEYPTAKKNIAKGELIIDHELKIPTYWLSHYMAHAYSAYFPSNYNESDIICLDGGGDFGYGAIFTARGNKLKLIKCLMNENYGLSYNFFGHLIYDTDDGFYESKVMSMAAYGNPNIEGINDYFNDRILHQRPYKSKIKVSVNEISLFQKQFEDSVIELISNIENKSKNLSCAGGCFYNILLNSKIALSSMYESIYIPPYSGDMGTAIGCALFIYLKLGNKPSELININSPYLGNELNPKLSEVTNAIIELEEKYICRFSK